MESEIEKRVYMKRKNLLKALGATDWPLDSLKKISDILMPMSDSKKEESAELMLTMLQSSKSESEFISKMEKQFQNA